MWTSRPEVRVRRVQFEGQQPEDETPGVKEFLEEGDDPRPKVRPLDSCPLPLASKCLLTCKRSLIFPDPVLTLLGSSSHPRFCLATRAFLILLPPLLAAAWGLLPETAYIS